MVFGLFTRCPLDDPREKAWTELRMQWLSEQFGLDALRNADVLLPTPECFPEPYGGTVEDVERMTRRLCGQLRINPGDVDVDIGLDEAAPRAGGTYRCVDGKAVIRVSPLMAPHQEYAAAVLGHELAHHRLLGEGRLSQTDEDYEELTDLLPVYFGAGVFAANSTVQDASSTGGLWHQWSISRQGYLASRMFGYAFALFAWVRDERNPDWAGHLRKDARDVFQAALRYLRKTGDSYFRHETAGRRLELPTTSALVADLKSGSPGTKVIALWRLQVRGVEAAAAVADVLQLTRERQAMFSATALEALSAIVVPDVAVETELRPLLRHAHPAVRSMTILAMLKASPRREECVLDFSPRLNDANSLVANWAAYAIGKCGSAAREAEADLYPVLKRAIVRHDGVLAMLCLHALKAADVNPDSLRDVFPDPEIHGQAIDDLRELNELGEPPPPPDPFVLTKRPGIPRVL